MLFLKKYWFVLFFIFLGIMTLLPFSASKTCYLGYYSYCSFTPIRTIILWGIAALAFWRISRKGREES